MSIDLYFIPIIIAAFRQPDSRAALSKAFARIRDLVRDPAYAAGYQQFEVFMDIVAERVGARGANTSSIKEMVAQIMAIEMADRKLKGHERIGKAAEAFVRAFPSSRLLHRRLQEEFGTDTDWADEIAIRVEKDGKIVAEATISPRKNKAIIGRISAGKHTVQLGTGRVIWEALLEEKHIIWRHARPGEPLELAAATEEGVARPTLEAAVLGGELTIRVFAGMRFGRMEITGAQVSDD